MSIFATAQIRTRAHKAALLAGACTLAAMAPCGAAQAEGGIPQFQATGYAWDMMPIHSTNFDPLPEGGPQPIINDPRYPHIGNHDPGSKTDRVTDISNPILQPWAAEQIKKTNDAVIERGRTPFVATSLCWPNGVPGQMLVPTAIHFIQKANVVYMIYERDHYTRRIWLNAEHAKNPPPTWFGDSVGHYENGDTLVIDTIGLSDSPVSFIDNFRTPHTKALHVVENYKIINTDKGGKQLEARMWVDDPGAFTTKWGGFVRYEYKKAAMPEQTCAENNPDYFGLDDFGLPTAKTLDF